MYKWLANRAARRRCHAALDRLGLPAGDLSIDTLRRHVEKLRGRPMSIREMPTDGPHGLWIAMPGLDVVGVESNTTSWHQRFDLCHEFGHMALEHLPRQQLSLREACSVLSDDELQEVFPDIWPVAKRVLGANEPAQEVLTDKAPVLRRDGVDAALEAETDYLATLLARRMDSSIGRLRVDGGDSEGLERLMRALGDQS